MEVNFRNFEFHENEEVTYDSISRVFNAIYELQVAIINTITAGDNEEDEEEQDGIDVGVDIAPLPGGGLIY